MMEVIKVWYEYAIVNVIMFVFTGYIMYKYLQENNVINKIKNRRKKL